MTFTFTGIYTFLSHFFLELCMYRFTLLWMSKKMRLGWGGLLFAFIFPLAYPSLVVGCVIKTKVSQIILHFTSYSSNLFHEKQDNIGMRWFIIYFHLRFPFLNFVSAGLILYQWERRYNEDEEVFAYPWTGISPACPEKKVSWRAAAISWKRECCAMFGFPRKVILILH